MPAISLTAATGFLASSLALRTTNTTGGANYCTYGQPCWPSLDSWSALNYTLDGNLFAPLPPASPCHTAHYDAGACATVREKWTDAYWRLDQIGAFENANWEDGQIPEEQCFYNNDASAPCGQGMVPPMMAEVHSVSDVQNSIAFALKNRLRFRIKGQVLIRTSAIASRTHILVKSKIWNSGGRSSAAGAFAIWTRKLRGINFDPAFIPKGCSRNVASRPAVTVAAGEIWQDVYAAADKAGVVVVGGQYKSVGAAGGWALGGGHSPISATYGLGVDNQIEFSVVTPDGVLRTANECQNSQLFWALRGGGGAFGVVMNVTYQTHPKMTNFLTATIAMNSTDQTTHRDLTTEWFKLFPQISDLGYSAYTFSFYPDSSVALSLPNAPSDAASVLNKTIAPLYAYASQHPGVSVGLTSSVAPSFWSVYSQIDDSQVGGTGNFVGSRLVPRDVFANAQQAAALSELTTRPGNPSTPVLSMVAGGAVAKFKASEVSANPGWRKALVTYTFLATWPQNLTTEGKNELMNNVTSHTAELDKFSYGLGCYSNEGDPAEKNWQRTFFGDNYPALLAIKLQVDPHGVLECRRCVGSDVFGY